MTERKLAGKAVMMTGAGRGLGRSMALALAREGAKLALVDLDGEELAVAGEVRTSVARFRYPSRRRRMRSRSSATAVFYAIENFGRLDVLFNNAALGPQAVADPYETCQSSGSSTPIRLPAWSMSPQRDRS